MTDGVRCGMLVDVHSGNMDDLVKTVQHKCVGVLGTRTLVRGMLPGLLEWRNLF